MAKDLERVQLLHPEGKSAPTISIENYNLFHKAIMQIMKNADAPITWTQMAKEVTDYLATNNIHFKGSAAWFAISVKMHLEATGVIENFVVKGKKLHRLKEGWQAIASV